MQERAHDLVYVNMGLRISINALQMISDLDLRCSYVEKKHLRIESLKTQALQGAC